MDKHEVTQEIKDIIAETITELHQDKVGVEFKKPTTLQGWLAVCFSISLVIGFFVTSAVFLNKVTNHHTEIAHEGTLKLLEKLDKADQDHKSDNSFHRREEQLQLQILQETKPIYQKLNDVKRDVNTIETKVDILIDREFKK